MVRVLPTRWLAALMAVGFLDLFATAWLHSQGLIVEMNPLMRPIIEHSEVAFALVKALTLVIAWVALAWYARTNLEFVRRWTMIGTAAYVGIWTVWFVAGFF